MAPESDFTGELHHQSIELAQLCEYLDSIADIPGRYRLSNFIVQIYLMEIPRAVEPSAVLEGTTLSAFGKEFSVGLTPLEHWQIAVQLVLDFVQEMLDDGMYDDPRVDGWLFTRSFPFIGQKFVDDGRQPPPGKVHEEERAELIRRFAAFFQGKPVQAWQMHISRFPRTEGHDFTFGIFAEHVLFAVDGKRYWLQVTFSD